MDMCQCLYIGVIKPPGARPQLLCFFLPVLGHWSGPSSVRGRSGRRFTPRRDPRLPSFDSRQPLSWRAFLPCVFALSPSCSPYSRL